MRPPENMHHLIRRIEKHKRLEDDQLQIKGMALAVPQYHKDPCPRSFQQKPQRKARGQNLEAWTEKVNMVFKESVHQILERIKHESYFHWPDKMGGDPTRRNQSLYYMYHRDKGHTTEKCKTFKDHLEQLVKARHLRVCGRSKGWHHGANIREPKGSTAPSLWDY